MKALLGSVGISLESDRMDGNMKALLGGVGISLKTR